MASQVPSAGPSHQGEHNQRILCPVIGCPESLTSSTQKYYDFTSIRKHLNAHCTGQLSGAVPLEFLGAHGFSLCNVCDKTLSSRYNGTCPKCRPFTCRQVQLSSIHSRNGYASVSHQQHVTQNADTGPSLFEIHEKFVPTTSQVICQNNLD